MAQKKKKTVEEYILSIENHLAEIDGALVKSATDRSDDLNAMQHSFELLKADLDEIRGKLGTVDERLKRLETRSR